MGDAAAPFSKAHGLGEIPTCIARTVEAFWVWHRASDRRDEERSRRSWATFVKIRLIPLLRPVRPAGVQRNASATMAAINPRVARQLTVPMMTSITQNFPRLFQLSG